MMEVGVLPEILHPRAIYEVAIPGCIKVRLTSQHQCNDDTKIQSLATTAEGHKPEIYHGRADHINLGSKKGKGKRGSCAYLKDRGEGKIEHTIS